MKKSVQLTVLGPRGSMATGRKDCVLFGGDSSCYMVRAGEETLFLDAGSGLLAAPTEFPRTPHILLSHLHLDHLLGLGMYPRLSQEGRETLIHVPTTAGEDPLALLDGLYSPPYWPLSLRGYAGTVRVLPLALPLAIGELTVEGIPGNHPNGSLLLKLSWRGKRIVYATDYEYEESSFSRLAAFSRDADLLLYDGQFSEEELPARRGFGHSTPEKGMELMERSRAKKLLLIHHDPRSGDELLLEREAGIARESVRFAREGEEIIL